jgi:hypothetical protein
MIRFFHVIVAAGYMGMNIAATPFTKTFALAVMRIKMRKVILMGAAKTVGTDFAEAAVFEDGASDDTITEAAWQASIDNAQMYGYEYSTNESEEDDYDSVIYDHELDYYWEDYNPDKHDDLRCGGGSFEEEFNYLIVKL